MLGYQTLMAHDGLEAVRSAASYLPDIALLDIGLPHMSGYEAAKQIRALPCGERLLLVALSGWGQEEDRRKSKAAGFDHHFVKPVDIDALTNVLVEHEHYLAASALPSPVSRCRTTGRMSRLQGAFLGHDRYATAAFQHGVPNLIEPFQALQVTCCV